MADRPWKHLTEDEIASLLAWHEEEKRRNRKPPRWMWSLAQRHTPYHLRGRSGRQRFEDRYWRRDVHQPGWGFDWEGNPVFYAPSLIAGASWELRDPVRPDFVRDFLYE